MGDNNEDITGGGSDVMSRQEAMGRFEELDQSVKKIFDLLSGMAGQQQQGTSSPPVSTSSSGLSGAGSSSSGTSNLPLPKLVHPATAPTDIQVTQQTTPTTLPAQSPSQLFSALSGGSPAAAGIDQSVALQKAIPTGPAASVSPALQPVPGYLVDKIKEGKFVDLNVLRPYNLKKLPTAEPNQLQLAKLFRTDLRNIQILSTGLRLSMPASLPKPPHRR
eukprot:Seg650.8 transcript_id=Seg650.8/GoldUCD/mRNA.D3Y31 product="hypothetical protein" protein_id=Seg650.8/GoldUCD/D3Y31